MTTRLWPPIGTIRETRGVEPDAGAGAPPASAQDAMPVSGLPAALRDLLDRRQGSGALAELPPWREGQLLSLSVDGRAYGVLLDRQDSTRHIWTGWLASAELDWAGPFDVLLEPEDEPFEPAAGLIQTWNPVEIDPRPGLAAVVIGRISATRLAAIRSVAWEAGQSDMPDIVPEPGRIALRASQAGWSVLTGTPLGAEDPRQEYQAVYRQVAEALRQALQANAVGRVPASVSAPQAGGWWRGLIGWFGADRWVRPAFAVLLAAVLLQAAPGWWSPAVEQDEVRFRGVPETGPADELTAIRVEFEAAASFRELAALMQQAAVLSVEQPDGRGPWVLRVRDPEAARRVLSASRIVNSIQMP